MLQLKRYKTMLFSDLRFLKSVQKSARKQQKIRHWIILALRILAWSLLTLAFAMPFLPQNENFVQRKSIAIFVDNSPSMTQKGAESPLWVQAVESAQRIVAANPQSDFLILTPSMEYAGQIKNSTAAKTVIDEIRPSSASSGWNQLVKSLRTFNREDTIQVYVLTDAQVSSTDNLDTSDLNIELYPVIYQPITSSKNISIDTAYLNAPVLIEGQNVKVDFELKSFSNENVDASVELWVNGEWKGVKNVSIQAETIEKSTLTFQATEEQLNIEIRLEDGDQEFDNTYFISTQTVRSKRIAHLYESGVTSLNVDSIIRDSAYQIESFSYDQVPFGQLAQFDLIIADYLPNRMIAGLSQALRTAVEGGASALLFPGSMTSTDAAELGIANYGDEQKDSVDNLQLTSSDAFFDGLFYEAPKQIKLPTLLKYSPISRDYQSLGGISLIQSPGGEPSLVRYTKGLGQLYQWNSHPVRDQMGRTELYTAILYQMAIFKEDIPLFSAEIGSQSNFRIEVNRDSDEPLMFVQDSTEVIPRQSTFTSGIEFTIETLQFKPGFAAITYAGDTLAMLALNTNRKESDLSRMTEEELSEFLSELNYTHRISSVSNSASAQNYIDNLNSNHQTSKWWIMAAIIVLILEMVLWRQPKT